MTTIIKTRVEPFYAEVGQKIRSWRAERGITQEVLGRSLNPPMSRVSIANIESGTQRIYAHTLFQIIDALKIEIVDLLPKKAILGSQNLSDITDEIASKLGISRTEAKKIATKTKIINVEK